MTILEHHPDMILNESPRAAAVRSKIYGYAFADDGEIVVVEKEAAVIENVISQLADIPFLSCEKILTLIANEYRRANPRILNRSKRLWSPKTLALLCRPIYAGLEVNSLGILVRTFGYPEIVSASKFKLAWKRLKREKFI